MPTEDFSLTPRFSPCPVSPSAQPSSSHSFVSEEEESITVSSSCSCQHDPECTVGIVGGSLQAAAVAESEGSVEVRDRLVELQGRNSTLEQEKV